MPENHYNNDRARSFETLSNGVMIGHYRIIEKIGAGGMGEVYLAEDTELNRKVALKFLPPHLCLDADCRARFKREAQAAAKLSHPNIVTIHEVAEHHGRPFIAMEYVEGLPLDDHIKEKAPSLEKIVELAVQICEGLAKAHQAGIVHRDIKPSNILIDQDGRAKILDFGLATIKGTDKLTKTGSTLGTLSYMSPEQTRGEDVDHRSDIFSFGAVLYEMITGQLPFKGDHEPAVMYAIAYEEPEPLARYKTGVPDELQRIVSKALAKSKDERYQHVDEILADLRTIQHAVPHQSLHGHKNKRLPLFIGGSVLLALVVLGYFLLRTPPIPVVEKSIAVLPFIDMSPQKDQAYFCDGMTEELINRLGNIRELKVPARTSVFTFKGKSEDIRVIGKKLGVAIVLEGSVRKAGNRLRITIQLINIADGYHLWSETYDREINDVFAIQDDISSAVVGALQIRLTADEKQRVARRPIDNVAAYECYMKADYEISRWNEEGIRRAIQYLQSGIDLIGDNPLLYAGMAYACFQLANIGVEQEDYIQKAEEWAQKALALDPNLPEVNTVLAEICFWRDYPENMREVIRYNKRALEVNPNEPDALRSLSYNYMRIGRILEAQRYLAQAEVVDPLNVWNNMTAGYVYLLNSQYDLALVEWNKAYHMDPSNPALQFMYAWTYALTGQQDSAFFMIDKGAQATPDNVLTKCGLMLKYGLQKDRKQAFQVMTPEFRKTCWRDMEWSYNVAIMLALLDDRNESLDWLENAVNRGFINYPALQQHPFLQNVRGEERFKKLMERAKYEWEHFEE